MSQLQYLTAKEIKLNPNNPRLIKDDKFKKLVKSIQEFPEMMPLRPIVIDEGNYILGGNMRFRAMQEAGVTLIPVIVATGLTEEQKHEFVIKDNVSFGDWDWDILANELGELPLADWGVNVPAIEPSVDYSVLDEQDVSRELEAMQDGVKKAVLIEFNTEHYEDALKTINFWRGQGLYIGGFLIEKLKEEQSKLA
jgi:ParB-like chromosome segregation protein Spo0J